MVDLPDDVRKWWYFPIIVPLDEDGYGPEEDFTKVDKITFEVWDQNCESHGSFSVLPLAINKAMELNKRNCKKYKNMLIPKDYPLGDSNE